MSYELHTSLICDLDQTLTKQGAYTASDNAPVRYRVWPHETSRYGLLYACNATVV